MYAHQFNTPELLAKQAAWETEGVSRGVERYHESLVKKTVKHDGTVVREEAKIGDTQAGMELLNDILSTAIPAVQIVRADAIAHIENPPRGGNRDWWQAGLPITLLSAEMLAYLTLKAILAEKPSTAGQGRKVTHIATAIGTSVMQEIEFKAWKAKSAQDKAEGTTEYDLAQMMISKHKGTVDTRTFKRWRKKLTLIAEFKWETSAKVAIGTQLIDIMLTACPVWFEVGMARSGQKTERVLFLSEKSVEKLLSVHERLHCARPQLMPMWCPPIPWSRKEVVQPKNVAENTEQMTGEEA